MALPQQNMLQDAYAFADGKDHFPLVMVGKVLMANKRWDIGKEVIDCVTKTYPGAYPIHPKVNTNAELHQ